MTILWNEVTTWWNEVTKGWNEVVWNEVVMERSGRNSLKFLPTWQKLCSNATPNLLGMPGNFFLKITRGLKPRHCRPFLLSHSLRKPTYLPPTSSKIQMYDTFFLPERIETCGLDFSP